MPTLIQVGTRVTVPATTFDHGFYAHDEDRWSFSAYGDSWRSAEFLGTVLSVTFDRERCRIKWDLDSTTSIVAVADVRAAVESDPCDDGARGKRRIVRPKRFEDSDSDVADQPSNSRTCANSRSASSGSVRAARSALSSNVPSRKRRRSQTPEPAEIHSIDDGDDTSTDRPSNSRTCANSRSVSSGSVRAARSAQSSNVPSRKRRRSPTPEPDQYLFEDDDDTSPLSVNPTSQDPVLTRRQPALAALDGVDSSSSSCCSDNDSDSDSSECSSSEGSSLEDAPTVLQAHGLDWTLGDIVIDRTRIFRTKRK